MEHYLVEIDGRLIVASGKDKAEARQRALSAHSEAYSVKIIAEVSDVISLLRAYILIDSPTIKK